MSRRILLLIVNLLLCLLVSLEASSFSVGSRAILRSLGDNEDIVEGDCAVELNATNFDAVIRDTPAAYVVVEFFANWCPACRNYKPQYERVARLFNGPDAAHPGIILMARVDCALKINTNLCDKFTVDHFPMLLWGPPAKFLAGSWEPNQENSEIQEIEDFMTADRVLNFINKQTSSSFALDDEKFENEQLSSNISDPGQIARAVYDVEEATSTAFDIILDHKMIKSETRASIIRFLQVLVAHHPSRWCRKGSADILMNFDEFSPLHMQSADELEVVNSNEKGLGNFSICGKEVPRGYWIFCRGSRNDTRGFSCGLWVLLHSLSVRIEDGESQFTFTAICDFIHNFFICEECRQHFYEMCSSVTTPFNKTRDFALWLWSTHNKVSERLMKIEASLKTGDPKFPKTIWPPKQLCSSCHHSDHQEDMEFSQIDWDEDEVFKFLTEYYGKTLGSLHKDRVFLRKDGTDLEDLVVSTSAVAVPVGAALAIALASCAFGALACYWRTQQKNRKPRRSWN